ncbi:MAG: Hpt domain-containing protein, partial [Clostridia bacterium]|nr:Hpt domain-containing protein [Clostridia bacterium]
MRDETNNMEPMLDIYIFETSQLLEQLEQIILKCEKKDGIDYHSVNEVFRIMHTIKGSSAMMLFNNIAELTHCVEDLFSFIRENKPPNLDASLLCDTVLCCKDFIKNQIEIILSKEKKEEDPQPLIETINSYLAQLMDGFTNGIMVTKKTQPNKFQKYYISKLSDNKQKKYKAFVTFEKDAQMENIRAFNIVHHLNAHATGIMHVPKDILEDNDTCDFIKEHGFTIYFTSDKMQNQLEKIMKEAIFIKKLELQEIEEYDQEVTGLYQAVCKEANIPSQDEIKQDQNQAASCKKQGLLTVNIDKLNYLMDLVGEIVISEAMVIKNPDLQGLELDNFQKAARQLRKLTDELQDVVMSIRMVPVDTTFRKMNRIVRDMGKKLDKEVSLKLIGEETEVDKNIIDHLSDPLMHLIRNAVDHGIETADEREKLKKSKIGNICLEARNAGGDVWITVSDDGRGLNRDGILRKALENGL